MKQLSRRAVACGVGRRGGALRPVALLSCLCAQPLHAGQTQATVNVRITVPAITRLEVLSQAQTLEISALDLQRGYIDVPQPTQLKVYSNAAAGFALEVSPMLPQIRTIVVRGLNDEALLGADGGQIVQHSQGNALLTLRFRLGLSPDAQPGTYPWPVHLAVQPLEPAPPVQNP